MPVTLGTSTNVNATTYPFQRKCFYTQGKFWVFYSDGTNLVYCTSANGTTWNSPTTVRAGFYGHFFSIWFDGTYVHYVHSQTSVIHYRRGTPNADGTITWSASEQTVSTDSDSAYVPHLSVDTNGYAWIGYLDSGLKDQPWVIKSGNNDGTWGTTPAGFPYKLNSTDNPSWKVSIVPLTAGKMLAVFSYDGETVHAESWDGAAWRAEVETTIESTYAFRHSVCVQGDDVHGVFLEHISHNIFYARYDYLSNAWVGETNVQPAATDASPALCIEQATNDLYCFWIDPPANNIYYKKRVSGAWDASPTNWVTDLTLTGSDKITCFRKDYGGHIGVVWMIGTGSPYDIRFAMDPWISPEAAMDLRITIKDGIVTKLVDDGVLTKLMEGS